MQTGSGTKNPPWARSNVNTNMTGINPQLMDANAAMMSQQGMMPFQQTQAVFNPSMMQAQGGMTMPMAGQMPMNQMAQTQMYPGNVVAYPTPRAMNPNMFQNNTPNQTQPANEQRVFTGTVTKTHNDFGFVDHDVFYQTSVCAKGSIPKVNDRVLVEATYNPNMPFKWNATRVQVLPKGGPNQKVNPPKPNVYNAVPPPSNKKPMLSRRDDRRDDRGPRRDDRMNSMGRQKRSRTRSRSRSRDRRDSRNRRDSPPRKRPVMHQPSPVKYVVRVPRIPLDIQKIDVPTLSQRYTNLYIPSDFFNANVKWGEAFPPQAPFSLNNPCAYHIMSKDVPDPSPNDTVLEPPDADYRYSAKVMLISMPTLESLYQKCGLTKVDEKDKRTNKIPLHPTRLIKFLVGQKGKGGENFAIGGPWSPSLDGDHPDTDPGVLVKTAIRTCKALTGIDLSNCTQWYRMVEFYYWREGGGGKSRLECVVLFLPDVWSAQPSRVEWTTVADHYKAACDAAARQLDGADDDAGAPSPPAPAADGAASPGRSQIETKVADADSSTITIDENDDDDEGKPEPSHYSKIDLRTIKVDQLRQELRARNVSCKGLRAQLVSRLSKIIKTEEEKEQKGEDIMDVEDDEQEEKKEISEDKKEEEKVVTADEPVIIDDDKEESEDKKDFEKKSKEEDKKDNKDKPDEKKDKPKTEKEIEEERKRIEKEKLALRARYELPTNPHIIVHPSTTAKAGKFTCNVATLSLLLDYRITDNKEHSFELFVFAELFNEMLMRDFGFYVYKTLYTLPEKPEKVEEGKEKDKSVEKTEKKDETKTDTEKKEEKKDDKDKKDDKKEEIKKEDKDKRDDKRDFRRRDRRDSHSDEERSQSPRRRSRGVELPPDPYLLLSLVYFDTARGGHVTRKDLQSLFMGLGLQLSRSQVRAVLEKVCVREAFTYKTLIQAIKDLSGSQDSIQDLPLDGTVVANEVPTHITELEAAIASGNRDLLPVFKEPKISDGSESSSGTRDVSDAGVVTYKARVVDVGALVQGAARWAGERARLEGALRDAHAALKAARAAAARTQHAERGAQVQLHDVSSALAAARARIASLTASSKIFHSTLKSIQSKVEAVVNIKYEDDDVVEIVNGPTKNDKQTSGTDDKSEELKREEIGDAKDRESDMSKHITKIDENSKESEDSNYNKETDIIRTENMDIDDRE